MSVQQFKLIFSDVAKKLEMDLGEVGESSRFIIQFKQPGVPRIIFDYLPEQDSVLICSEVGFVDKDRESELLHSIMHRQLLWLKSSGVTFAMATENNAIVAQMLLSVQLMTVDSLGQALSDFTAQLIAVRRELFGVKDDAGDAEGDSDYKGLKV